MSRLVAAPSPRALDEQAECLVTFLDANQHSLTAGQAASALASLPEDPRAAAKELRVRLQAHGVDLKHTHALKAIAEARGATGHLGLGSAVRWDIAAWFADAPAVSPRRRLHVRLGDAADDACRRIKEVFEDYEEEPHLRVTRGAGFLEFMTLAAPAPFWHLLLVATKADGSVGDFPAAEQRRLIERVRRLVEGDLGGWLDGHFDPELLDPGETESDLVMRLVGAADGDSLPELPPSALALARSPQGSSEWDGLRRRLAAFARRHPDVSPRDWFVQHQDSPDNHRFADEPYDVGAFETARIRAGLSVAALAEAAGLPAQALESLLSEGRMPTHLFERVAAALGLPTPNELLFEPRATPRIPLLSADDLPTWLARIPAEVVDYEDSPPVPPQLRRDLVALTREPKKQAWLKQTPPAFKSFHKAAQLAGLMVCASMTKRFVQDLPLGRWRLGMVATLSFKLESVVRSQPGLERHDDAGHNDVDDEGEDITAEWLERFNSAVFTGDELLKLSGEVERERHPDGENFELSMYVAARHFKGRPGKAFAAITRMQAMSRLIETQSLEPWVLKSPEDGASMLSRPVFEATARCPLVDIKGKAGFDFQTFYNLCVEFAEG